jgi:hypothetical protein
MTTEKTPNELVRAVNAVMSDVGYIQKDGKSKQGYTYASDAGLLRKVQPSMAKNGLTIAPTEMHLEKGVWKSKKGEQIVMVHVLVTYTLMHISGERMTLQAWGCGWDFLDKAVSKAMTMAFKYVLRQTFAIPTGDDPDAANEDDGEIEYYPAYPPQQPPQLPPPQQYGYQLQPQQGYYDQQPQYGYQQQQYEQPPQQPFYPPPQQYEQQQPAPPPPPAPQLPPRDVAPAPPVHEPQPGPPAPAPPPPQPPPEPAPQAPPPEPVSPPQAQQQQPPHQQPPPRHVLSTPRDYRCNACGAMLGAQLHPPSECPNCGVVGEIFALPVASHLGAMDMSQLAPPPAPPEPSMPSMSSQPWFRAGSTDPVSRLVSGQDFACQHLSWPYDQLQAVVRDCGINVDDPSGSTITDDRVDSLFNIIQNPPQ